MAQIITVFRRRTTKALASLQKEISRREEELEAMKAEAARWESVLGRPVKAHSAPASSGRAKSTRRGQKAQRLDWSTVLEELSKAFTTKEMARMTGKTKDSVYAAARRWVKAKKVRKAKKGYQKV